MSKRIHLEYRGHIIAEVTGTCNGYPTTITVITRGGTSGVSLVHGAAVFDDALAKARRIVDHIHITGEEALAMLRQRGFVEVE